MDQATATTTKEPSMFDMPEWTGIAPQQPTAPAIAERPLAGVRFQAVGKVYHYDAAGFPNLKLKDWVIVDTVRGKQMGQVATLNPPKGNGGPYKRIDRLATGRDMAMRHYYENKELEAMIACRAENAALKLPIKIARAEYSFDGQTLTFMYSSDEEERIETNVLRDVMSRLYQAKIEMRQISPREVAKIVGGLGACGIESRCCSRFLTEFSPISIKHAKEQNLSLNPHDITGMCGRLRCCLVFEYEQYVEAKRSLPKMKSVVGTPKGEGKVVEVNPMRDTVIVQFKDEAGIKTEMEFHREQIVPLEEWKRLQEKATSGTCDKHEGGGCDCGKDKKTGDAKGKAAEPKQEMSPAAQAFIQANEVRQAESDARARAEVVRERNQKRRDERDAKRAVSKARRNEPENASPNVKPIEERPASPPQARMQYTPEELKAREERRRSKDKKDAARRPRDEQRPQERPPTKGHNPQSGDANATKPPSAERPSNPSQQQRRPLKKPLPRRNTGNASGNESPTENE